MSIYSGVVTFNWKNLEKQPLYVKSKRRENKRQTYSIELAVDRSGDEKFRCESFRVYGPMITDAAENSDVEIEIDPDQSSFISQQYGAPQPYLVLKSFAEDVNDNA